MYAYARSPDAASLEATKAAFLAAGASRTFADNKARSAIITPELDAMLSLTEPGTVILIDSLKSFGSDLRDVFEVVSEIHQRQAHLVILDVELDTRVNDAFFRATAAFASAAKRVTPKPVTRRP